MALDLFLLLISFLIIIGGAELFTNAVEWLGIRMRLSEGAVGSVLAAVGTALPETLIPVVALVFFKEAASHEIGLGAILGAPFMLATLAFFVTALAAWICRRRRETGWRLLINRRIMSRDLSFFLLLYTFAITASFLPEPHHVRPLVAVALLFAYSYYLYLNFREKAEGEKEEPLVLNVIWAMLPLFPPGPPDREAHSTRRQHLNGRPPRLRAVIFQLCVSLGMIIGGAYEFVNATREIATAVGFSPMVFALLVAPVATELPEKFNSVTWVRQGKDTLALGNITGAMVFQSTFPVTLGILLTPWHFHNLAGEAALFSAFIALVSGLLLLITIRLHHRGTMSPWVLLAGGAWWLLFVGYVLIRIVP